MSGERRRAGPRPGSVAARGQGPGPAGGARSGEPGGSLNRPPARPGRPVVEAGSPPPPVAPRSSAAPSERLPTPASRARGPPPPGLRDPGHPGALVVHDRRGSRPRPAPLPRQAEARCAPRAARPGHRFRAAKTGGSSRAQARPLLGFSSCAAAAAAVRVWASGAPGLPTCAVPSPRAHLAVGPGGGDGRAPRVPLKLDRRAPQAARGPAGDSELRSARGLAELAAEAGGSRGGGGVGAAGWVGQEKRRETALCRFPLPAGRLLLPREKTAFPFSDCHLLHPEHFLPACLEARRARDLMNPGVSATIRFPPPTLFEFSANKELHFTCICVSFT